MPTLDLIATSAFGLEAVVAREIKALGYAPQVIQPGRILFQGEPEAIARANLWLRSADRVLLRMGTFAAADFGALFDRTFALDWEEWLDPSAGFPVNGRSIKSQLSSVPACQKIVKKAIVEKLRAAHGVETLDETGPQYSIEVALLGDQATLTIDTSGAGLHKRGYRRLVGKAALKETLAAALVMLSFWRPERPLIDPFCGTGTIPIEAAMIGRRLAPGLRREFAAEAWPRIPQAAWSEARREAADLALPELPVRIIGTDSDEKELSLARYHAEQAGVATDLHFQQRDFAQLTSKRHYGCVITNPPYGERMGNSEEVEAIYRGMPTVLRRLKTWSHYILTSHRDFEQIIGQPADRRRKLYNGRLECTYYQFHGPRPRRPLEREDEGSPSTDDSAEAADSDESPVLDDMPVSHEKATVSRAPLRETPREPDQQPNLTATSTIAPPRPQAFGGLSAKALEQAELLRTRLKKRAHHLRRWPRKHDITCYRLYERDILEIPLVIDRYEDWLHIAEFERPHERTPAEHADWLDLMARTAGEVMEVPPSNVFMKHRDHQRGTSQYERREGDTPRVTVGEGGLKFWVNLADYLDTGLFLDHRVTRAMVRDAARGSRFLNLFAYTGSFTVYAADGPAAATTTVDLSNTYLDWARDNMSLNGFTGDEHRYVRADAMTFLERHPPGAAYDLAVVDPPTFSNSKNTDNVWDVQRDHVALLNRVLELMAPGGVVYFSTNFRRFKFDPVPFEQATVREISRQTVPPDFRNRRIHRSWRLVRR